MSAGTNGYGAGVTDSCIPFCDHLHTHLVEYQHVEHTRIAPGDSLPENLQAGDVIIFGNAADEWKHASIVVSGTGQDVRLNAHTNHRTNRDFDFFTNSFPIAHTYHFPTAAETGTSQGYFGTGQYYGERALQVVIYEEGENYEGYILPNMNEDQQDMVIAEDTSTYSGCSYFIEGYCTDAHKGIPSSGGTFGQPWTCDSPNHWAYWVRKAIIFANENDYYSGDTLDAVWYISDRSGYYNEILSSIGYSENGPDKNVNDSYCIQGIVYDVDGNPLDDVQVTLSGDISWNCQTNGSGCYEFIFLPEGTYTVTIDDPTLIADPPSIEYALLTENVESQNFIVTKGGNEGFLLWLLVLIVAVIILVGIVLFFYFRKKPKE